MKNKLNKIISNILCYFEYRKIRSGVREIITNNPRDFKGNDEYLIDKYSKILYNSNQVNRFTELKYYKKSGFFNNLRMKIIKLKYNAFNLNDLVDSNKHTISDYFIDVLIKFLVKIKGFNKPLEFNTVSSKLSRVEKWAVNVVAEEKVVKKFNSDFEKLVIKKEKEIARDFEFGVRHRDDEPMEFDKDIERVAQLRHMGILSNQIQLKMDGNNEFFKNYSKNNVKPKRKIFIVEYFKNIRNRFNTKWSVVKGVRAQVVLSNMKKRLEIINFDTFKSNLNNNMLLDEKRVLGLYNAVKMNKRLMAIR